jgi:hypothetical protein
MYTDEELKAFHRLSLRNEPEVKASRRCGCFYCFGFFSPAVDATNYVPWARRPGQNIAWPGM